VAPFRKILPHIVLSAPELVGSRTCLLLFLRPLGPGCHAEGLPIQDHFYIIMELRSEAGWAPPSSVSSLAGVGDICGFVLAWGTLNILLITKWIQIRLIFLFIFFGLDNAV
jgi:hypothetical protein